MPLAISFFGSKQTLSTPVSPAEGVALELSKSLGDEPFAPIGSGVISSPFPVNNPSVSAFDLSFSSGGKGDGVDATSTVILPTPANPTATSTVLPERRGDPRGLAAMVVRQSETEAPPLNKRQSFPLSPFAVTSAPLERPARVEANPLPQLTTSTPTTTSTQDLDLESIRLGLHDEIEQVKNDLFGAVMGVSALKDRLDGLETQLDNVQSSPAAHVSSPGALEIEPIITSWLNDHLPAAIHRMLAEAQEKMLGAPGAAFFRSSLPLSEAERQSLFSQPPTILNSTPV